MLHIKFFRSSVNWFWRRRFFKVFTNFEDYGCHSLKIIHNFHFCLCKSLCDQNWPCRKIGQGQPRVIIWTILVVLVYTMLHIKFFRSSVNWFWRRRFFKVFTNFEDYGCHSFKIIHNFHFCLCKSLCDQNWPCRKIGQGQPRVIIWTILVVLVYTMLHIKFFRSSVNWFWRRRFFKVFFPTLRTMAAIVLK